MEAKRMSGKSRNNYIHIYMDLSDDGIYFHSITTPYALGKSLIQFIDADLNEISAHPEQLRSIHPFFSTWSIEDSHSLFELSKTDDRDLDLKKIESLQNTYKKILYSLASDKKDLPKETESFFSKHPLFVKSSLIRKENKWLIDHFILGFEDCLICELEEMIRHHQIIKICKNCGRLFLPKRSNNDYCTRIFSGDKKTCAEVGYTKTFAKTVQNDELLHAYTRAYKAHYARMSKPRKKAANMSREAFDAWYKEAREGLELARQGKIDREAYMAWLKK